MGGRKSRYINEVLDWYRQEDARHLRRDELNDLVENTTALNALEGESWKRWKIADVWKSNQKIEMDEKS